MTLKERNIDVLIHRDLFKTSAQCTTSLLEQMLRAIDHLAYNGIIHRDVKPANILYTSLPQQCYNFQLADFGLCNSISNTRTYAGTSLFMAPEVVRDGNVQQTPKEDVWSLFVTLAYAMDIAEQAEQAVANQPRKIQRCSGGRQIYVERSRRNGGSRPQSESFSSADAGENSLMGGT